MTEQEFVTKSLEAFKAGQAIIEAFEKDAANGIGTFATKAPAEKISEVQKHLDEGENWKLQADTAHELASAERKLKEIKTPVRKFAFGVDDQNVADELARRYSMVESSRTRLDLKDSRFSQHSAKYGAASSPETHAAFEAYLRFGGPHLQDVEKHALTTLTDQEGGYLLTQEYRTEVIRKLRNTVHMRERSTVIQTSAAGVAFPTFDPADAQTTMPVTLPNQTITSASLSKVFGKTQFTPHARKVIIPIPMELLEDAVVDVGALLTDFWVLRLKEINEIDFMLGTGVNQPYGLFGPLGAGFPGSQTKAIAGSTTAVVPEDLVKTVYGLREVYRDGSSWLMYRQMVQSVRLFRTNIGGAGTGQFMFQPSVQAGQPATLFGYPLLESEFAPNPFSGSLAAAGCAMAMFGNLKLYWIVDRIDLMVQRLNERYADTDQIGFKLRQRYDAAPILADPFLFLTRN